MKHDKKGLIRRERLRVQIYKNKKRQLIFLRKREGMESKSGEEGLTLKRIRIGSLL